MKYHLTVHHGISSTGQRSDGASEDDLLLLSQFFLAAVALAWWSEMLLQRTAYASAGERSFRQLMMVKRREGQEGSD